MKPRKPDRFERTALNWWLKDLPEIDGPIIRSGIAKLLRKEHAWMRRLGKGEEVRNEPTLHANRDTQKPKASALRLVL